MDADGSDHDEPLDESSRELALAREIRREVQRFVSDDAADVGSLSAALDAIPRREQQAIARTVFDRLEPMQQWAVLERLLGGDGLREALDADQRSRLATLRRDAATAEVLAVAVDGSRFDLALLPDGTEVVLGLFRPEDVEVAAGRGRLSDICARRLVLRSTTATATFHVVDDEFNPRGGLFVSATYDPEVWESERLVGHSSVRVGSLVPSASAGAAPDLEPAVYRAGRVDVVVGDEVRPGRLHLGWATLGGADVFT